MDTSTQTIATFTGTLLRREHNPGQKFVQLVFRENGQNWLCISSKLVNVKLTIGQDYRVEGEFRQAGDRAYIHEPTIKLVRRGNGNKKSLRRRPVLIGGSIAAALLVVGGVVFALHGQPDTLKATNASSQTALQGNSDTSNDTKTPQTTNTDTTTPPNDTPPTTPPPKTTTPKTTPKTTNTNPTPPVTPAPVVAPPVSTAYCDAPTVIDVTYGDVLVPDDGTHVTGDILDPGTPGSQKMCYDDSTGSNPHPVSITAMVPGTKALVVSAP